MKRRRLLFAIIVVAVVLVAVWMFRTDRRPASVVPPSSARVAAAPEASKSLPAERSDDEGNRSSVFGQGWCSASFTVDPQDRCADAGRLDLFDESRGVDDREFLGSLNWTPEQAVVADWLPCESELSILIDSVGCARLEKDFGPLRGHEPIKLELSRGYTVRIRVVDAQDGTAIESAWLVANAGRRGQQGPSGRDGALWFEATSSFADGALVVADGYAPHHLLGSTLDFEWTGVLDPEPIDVPMRATGTAKATCSTTQSGPCPSDTRVGVRGASLKATDRSCTSQNGELWSCPVLEDGDQVFASHGGRLSDALPIGPGDLVELILPEGDGTLCLDWKGEACSARWYSPEEGESTGLVSSRDLPVVRSRTRWAAGLDAGREAVLLLDCGDLSWLGYLTVQPPYAEACVGVVPIDKGQLCLDGPSGCSYWLREGMLLTDGGLLDGCTGLVPAADYDIVCPGIGEFVASVRPNATTAVSPDE